jgi:murein DD-endopeptidase MepM/ murein hydrolase activator NlpD
VRDGQELPLEDLDPVEKKQVGMHNGVDLAIPVGTPLYSTVDGTASSVYWGDVGGHQVVITGDDGSRAGYAHLDRAIVEKGQRVSRGELIGYSGATGRVTGPHLHFTARRPGETDRVDPLDVMPVRVERREDGRDWLVRRRRSGGRTAAVVVVVVVGGIGAATVARGGGE